MDWLFLPPSTCSEILEQLKVYWLPEEGEGSWLTLDACAPKAQNHPINLVVPMEHCSAFSVRLPTRKSQWLRQAMSFAVEEFLAEDVEMLHLAIGEQLADEQHRVLAIRKELLHSWIRGLSDKGLKVGAIYCDADLLPRSGLQLLLSGPRWLLGGAGEHRLVMSPEQWPLLTKSHLNTEDVLTYGTDNQPPVPMPAYRQVNDPFRLLASAHTKATDLAQAEFAVEHEHPRYQIGKLLGWVAIFCFALQLGFTQTKSWYLEIKGDQFAHASRQIYQELFPQDTKIVNIRAQFDLHLSQSNDSKKDKFLDVLIQAARAIDSSKATVSQLDYSESHGGFSMQVKASDFTELEQLRQSMLNAGLSIQVDSASREEKGVTARLVANGDK